MTRVEFHQCTTSPLLIPLFDTVSFSAHRPPVAEGERWYMCVDYRHEMPCTRWDCVVSPDDNSCKDLCNPALRPWTRQHHLSSRRQLHVITHQTGMLATSFNDWHVASLNKLINHQNLEWPTTCLEFVLILWCSFTCSDRLNMANNADIFAARPVTVGVRAWRHCSRTAGRNCHLQTSSIEGDGKLLAEFHRKRNHPENTEMLISNNGR